MKTALLFGASGFVGSFLLEELLNHPNYHKVIIVVRQDQGLRHPKLKTLIGDFKSLPHLKSELVADDVFITLGTTKKKTPDPRQYYEIDHDYPVLAARLARENGAKAIFLLTAVGAHADSRFFYVKTKGETERDIRALGYPETHIFNPSMIMGTRQEDRPLEKFFMGLWSILDPLFLGPLSRYRGIEGKKIAQAMSAAAQAPLLGATGVDEALENFKLRKKFCPDPGGDHRPGLNCEY